MDTIHTPDFHCDFDGGNDGPTVTDQELPTGPTPTPSPDFKGREFQLPLPLPNRPPPELTPPISFYHLLAYPKTKTTLLNKVNNVT